MTDSKDPVVIDLAKYELECVDAANAYEERLNEIFDDSEAMYVIEEALQNAPDVAQKLWDLIRVEEDWPNYEQIGVALCNVVEDYVFDLAEKMQD